MPIDSPSLYPHLACIYAVPCNRSEIKHLYINAYDEVGRSTLLLLFEATDEKTQLTYGTIFSSTC